MIEDQGGTTTSEADVRDQLRDAAEQADASGKDTSLMEIELPNAKQGNEVAENQDGNRAADENANKKPDPDNLGTSAEKKASEEGKGKQVRDEKTGKFKKAEDIYAGKQQQQQTDGQNETKYQKAKKDAERYDRNWQKLNADQEAVRKREEELARREQELEQRRNEAPKKPEDSRLAGLPNLPSSEYWKAAQGCELKAQKLLEEGDFEAAREQLSLAKQAREAAQHFVAKENEQAHQQFEREWGSHVAKLITDVPEYADENSDLAKSMHELLKTTPVLTMIPNGFAVAHEYLTAKRDAAAVPGLRDEVTTLKAEVSRLTKLTTPLGEKNPSKHSASPGTEVLTREQLRAKAEEADGIAA